MGDKTSIGWCDTIAPDGTHTPGATWNPIRGTKGKWTCVRISDGCKNCYAATFNRRLGGPDYVVGADTPRLDEAALTQPLRWKRPRKIFVCSMTDLFWDQVPDEWVNRIFEVMLHADHHTFIVLTKRTERMFQFITNETPGDISIAFDGGGWIDRACWPKTGCAIDPPEVPPHIWMGCTIENQARAVTEAPIILQLPAAVRWVSMEPMLGPIDSKLVIGDHKDTAPICYDGRFLDWLVVGGESGRSDTSRWMVTKHQQFGYVPLEPAANAVRSIRDACHDSGVPLYLKQWGGPQQMSGGRLLDGIEHNGFPPFTGYDPLEYD